MRDVAKIPPKWAPSKRELRSEAMRNAFSQAVTSNRMMFVYAQDVQQKRIIRAEYASS